MLGTVENGLRCSPDIRELPIRTLILSVAILAASLFPSWAEAPATLTSLRAIHALSNSEADRANHVIF
jgi:hypothetical protein